VSEPLRLGLVCHASIGGSGVIATELATALARRGERVHLVSAGAPLRLDAGAGVTLHTVESPTHPLFPAGEFALALASRLVALCVRERLEVLHVHYGLPFAVSAYLARQALAAQAPRLVTTLHGTDVSTFARDPAFGPVLRLAVGASDAVTVPSRHLAGEARTHLGLAEVEVIGNFVDTGHYAPREPRPVANVRALFPGLETWDQPRVLLHGSNFRALKRIPDAIEVLARVRVRCPAVLVLVGDGPEREAVRRRAVQLGVLDAVAFVGEQAEVAGLLQASDVFLLPSETESFGLAALEALSCGVPVVATRTGGLPELIEHGRTGFLHEVGDVVAMAQSVLTLLDDEVRARFSRQARTDAVERWREGPKVDAYLACYRRVLGRPASGVLP
jgi:N-acetyl-alpha-D-glucosaminyl L-malate synthase BshA